VTIKEGGNVWNGAVIRGDDDTVEIGGRVTILENCIVEAPVGSPVNIGDEAIVSHGAIIHGATVGAGVLVGIGAIVLNRAEVGEGAIIGFGVVVPPRAVIPSNTLALSIPAKPLREVRDNEIVGRQGARASPRESRDTRSTRGSEFTHLSLWGKVKAEGQNSSSTHSSHLAFFASQTLLPCSMRR
jgi:carbonic anhydrase/acetyltransferase-like protein (isoleucine patch superfamily)